MLDYQIHLPEDVHDGAPLFVLLHGRGSDMHDLMGLQLHLPSTAIVVTPRAPFPGAPWGYGPGWAWYRFLGGDRPEPESFSEAQHALGEFLAELPDRLPVAPGPLVLGGFSQGGTMSLAHAILRPGAVPLVLNFSGFLAHHPEVVVTPESVRGWGIFWGHGIQDPSIPFTLAEQGREVLRQAGADLDARDYPIGHWIAPEELRDMLAWVEPRFAGQGS
jgi:phospholipase/carboxylesterase